MIVCFNKMDNNTVNFSQKRYNEIKIEVADYLKKIGYNPEKINFIPISGWSGDNIARKSDKMNWYSGPTLFEAIEALEIPKRLSEKPLRIPLQDIYKISGLGTVAVGTVQTGVLNPGMVITFAPNNVTAKCKSIEMHRNTVPRAVPGDQVGFNLECLSIMDLKRGFIASDSKNDPAKATVNFLGQVIVLYQESIISNG